MLTGMFIYIIVQEALGKCTSIHTYTAWDLGALRLHRNGIGTLSTM